MKSSRTEMSALVERVRESLADTPNVEEKKMFGSIAFMVNDKMCVAADAQSIMCRIHPSLHASAIERPGCSAVVMRGREYRGYIDVHGSALKSKESLKYWIDLCLDFNHEAKSSRRK